MSYIPDTEAERARMLSDIGVSSIDELYNSVPEDVRLQRPLDIPAGRSEFEVMDEMEKLAAENTVFRTVLRGAGAYRHYIPSAVKHLVNRAEFVTAYTPYQAELSQGILQCIFEYQTTIALLTGMDVSNAGVYDGSQAAAEAFAMCRDKKKKELLVFDNIRPDTLSVISTYAASAGAKVRVLPSDNGLCSASVLSAAVTDETAALYLETPNYFGLMEDAGALGEAAHAAGIKFIMGCEPVSLAVLKTPAACGADIAVGEAQGLGLPLSFGGPYLGYMAVMEKDMRKLPGRIVGRTTDPEGRTAYVLTLQAREQHIRREKASSSICSNESLCALQATIYCAAMGREGLREVSQRCFDSAHFLAAQLTGTGVFTLRYPGAFFDEFVTVSDKRSDIVLKALEDEGILGGLPLSDREILWCATEVNTAQEMRRCAKIAKEAE